MKAGATTVAESGSVCIKPEGEIAGWDFRESVRQFSFAQTVTRTDGKAVTEQPAPRQAEGVQRSRIAVLCRVLPAESADRQERNRVRSTYPPRARHLDASQPRLRSRKLPPLFRLAGLVIRSRRLPFQIPAPRHRSGDALGNQALPERLV